jgi:chorismate mutase / prephenate dehydratase
MNKPAPDLAALRRDIDRIDEAIHDLLMRRAESVLGIAEAKRASGDPVLRPAREAEVLRRLMTRHKGAFPKPALVRLWREIMAGHVHIQTKFSLAVLAPEGHEGLLRLALDHFGAATPVRRHDRAGEVLREVIDGVASVGILPLTRQDDADPWWPALTGKEKNTPRIAARLPFAPDGRPGAEALVVAPIAQEPSGRDHSYIVVESATPLSRHALTDALSAAGLPPVFLATAGQMHLAEVAEFVADGDARLAKLGAVAIGGYAVPFTADDLK